MSSLKKIQHRSIWYKKMYYYMHAGQSVVEALSASGNSVELSALREEIRTGKRMSEVCKDTYADIFSFIEISLMSAGENTGSLKDVFLSLSALLKAQYTQKQKLIASAVYPLIVLCLTVGLLILILVGIVPKIGPLFAGMTDLPISTRLLMVASKHFTGYWWIDGICVVAIVVAHMWMKRWVQYAHILGSIRRHIVYKTAYIKDVYILWYIDKWMQVMCICLRSHMSLHASAMLAATSIADTSIRKEFHKVQNSIADGNACHASLSLLRSNIYRYIQSWVSVIRSGENTGSLPDVFLVAHEHITCELADMFDRSQKILEPVLIIAVGVMVMLICLSIILPMYQLTQSINM